MSNRLSYVPIKHITDLLPSRLWDVEHGTTIASIACKSAVRTCMFSFSGNQAAYSTDAQMGHSCSLNIVDVREADASLSSAESTLKITVPQSKITSLLWGPLDETIISGHENGQISIWDLRMGKELNSVNDHTMQINDMQMSREGTMFVTASKDCTAKLFDSESLMCLKAYKTERPVNSASISPILDHVAVGGGQDAMEVTTTSTRVGKFDARFFYMVYEEEFGRVKGHFGPINSIVFSPDGKSFASGGEDGFVRVQVFDNNYFDFTNE